MKKLMTVLTVVMCFSVGFHLGGEACAQTWKLYDNFNSGIINTDKWTLPEGGLASIISVENGRAKFVHPQDLANTSIWLGIKENPETITGIRATVTIESADGDSLRARVGAWLGDFGDEKDAVWAQTCVQFRSEDWRGDRIFSSASLLERADNWPWLNDLNWSSYWNPIDVIGETFVIELSFDEKRYGYSVQGLGKGRFNFPEKLRKGLPLFAGIGTRTDSDASYGTVYFDDVYVFRGRPKDVDPPKVKSISPVYDAKKVPVNTQLIIKFNEPMESQFFGESDPDYQPAPGTTWEYQYPTTFIFTGPDFDPGVWIEKGFKKGWFQDAVGNPSPRFSFRFKTQAP